MKILEVITSMRTGGAEKMILDFIPKLVELGNQVDVAVFDGTDCPFLRILKSQSDCNLYMLGYSMRNPLHILKLIRIMKHYDIVQTHLTYPQFYVAIANLFVHTHIITTEHSTNNRRRGSRIFSRIDKWMYNRYEKIITISEKAEEKLREYLHDNSSDDIITIDNGIDVASFYEAKESRELRKGSDRFVMVMVASMHWQKDQDTIIRAMQYLPQDRFEFWIVGVGNRKPILEKLAKDLHVDSQVMFLGERTDIATILHTADVAIMSSHFEGLSLSSVEGMSVGHPFIASDVDGLHDTVVDAGILFPHEDAKALAKIVMRLDSDKEFYHEVAGKCLERAKQYDLQKTVTAYFNVYNKVYATSAAKS